MKVSEFKEISRDYQLSDSALINMCYVFADDGYYSNKYPGNKLLREECFPIIKFIKYAEIDENFNIQLGTNKYNFDAKIFNDETTYILELTSVLPDKDHVYLSLIKQAWNHNYLPVKNMHDFKKEFDMFPL